MGEAQPVKRIVRDFRVLVAARAGAAGLRTTFRSIGRRRPPSTGSPRQSCITALVVMQETSRDPRVPINRTLGLLNAQACAQRATEGGFDEPIQGAQPE